MIAWESRVIFSSLIVPITLCLMLQNVQAQTKPIINQSNRNYIMTAGDHQNLELMGRWGNGPCKAVCERDDTIFVANGTCLDIVLYSDIYTNNFLSRICFYELIVDIKVKDNYVFVARGKGGLSVVDIGDPANPAEVNHYHSGYSADRIELAGDNLFVVDISRGLKVLDVSTPENVAEIGAYDPGDPAINVYIHGNYAFLVTSNNGVCILDISDINDIFEITKVFEGESVSDVAVSGDFLYLVGDNYGLRVFSVEYIDTPIQVGSINANFGQCNEIVVGGNLAVIACGYSGIRVIDITVPITPIALSQTYTGGIAHDVILDGQYAYIADGYNDLHYYSLWDPDSPFRIMSYMTGADAWQVKMYNNYACIAAEEDGMWIVDCTDPANPIEIGNINTQVYTRGLDIKGSYAYLADSGGGLRVISMFNPTNPAEVAHLDISGASQNIFIQGDYAYIAALMGGLSIVDITYPGSPVLVGQYDDIYTYDLVVNGDIAYLTNHEYGSIPGSKDELLILNISYKTAPYRLGSIDLIYHADDIAIDGDYAYLPIGRGLLIVDISNPVTPIECSLTYTEGFASGVAVQNGYAYIADGEDGVRVFNVSDPYNPVEIGYFDTGVDANSVLVTADGTYIYSTDREGGLYIFQNELLETLLTRYGVKIDYTSIIIEIELSEIIVAETLNVLRRDGRNRSYNQAEWCEITESGSVYIIRDMQVEFGKEYFYKIELKNQIESKTLLETEGISIPALPLILHQNYPNPFNPTTTIKYYLPENGSVRLEIFDVFGKRIACMVNESQEKGHHALEWNGQDLNGNPVSSGTYFYRLKVGKAMISRKMVLLR